MKTPYWVVANHNIQLEGYLQLVHTKIAAKDTVPNGLYKNQKFLDASKEFQFCGRKKNHYFSLRIFGKKEREISACVLRRAPPLFLL